MSKMDRDKLKATLLRMPQEERQRLLEEVTEESLPVSSIMPEKIRKAISQLLSCMPRYEDRLRKILLDTAGGKLALVAADGFMLGVAIIGDTSLAGGQWVLPSLEAKELWRMLKLAQEVKLGARDGNLSLKVIFTDGEGRFLILPQSPQNFVLNNWSRFVPTSFTTKATFGAKEMKDALRKVMIEGLPHVRLSIEGDKRPEGKIRLIVKRNYNHEQREEVIGAEVEGESTKQAFFIDYFTRVVNILGGGKIVLQTSGYSTPALFERKTTRLVVLPSFVSGL